MIRECNIKLTSLEYIDGKVIAGKRKEINNAEKINSSLRFCGEMKLVGKMICGGFEIKLRTAKTRRWKVSEVSTTSGITKNVHNLLTGF